MVNVFYDIAVSFFLGLLTPLTAVCVLPLLPAFLAYLSNNISKKSSKGLLMASGFIMALGVITFMFLLGLIFTTFLQVSLTKIIGIISPIAFFILLIISILLILNIDMGRFFPKFNTPKVKNSLFGIFIFGFFFGAIVIPCNPPFIAALFARALAVMGFFANILNFIAFGIGISFPILLFSAISSTYSTIIINFLTRYRRYINLIAGIILLIISLYYLIYVFRIFG